MFFARRLVDDSVKMGNTNWYSVSLYCVIALMLIIGGALFTGSLQVHSWTTFVIISLTLE